MLRSTWPLSFLRRSGTSGGVEIDYGFVSASTPQFGTASPFLVPYPAGIQSGDLLLLQMARYISTSSTTFTDPSGWTRIVDSLLNSSNAYNIVWAKFADGSESGSISVSYSGGGAPVINGACMTAWRGVSVATPYENIQSAQASRNTLRSEPISTSHANEIVLTLHGVINTASSITPEIGEDTTCYTGSTTSGNNLSLMASYKKFKGKGAVGFSIASIPSANSHGTVNMALIADSPQAYTGSTAVTVTIPAGRVASDLTDFVTMVNLANFPSAWWAAVQSNGGDIRAKTTGGTVIPHDLVYWDYANQKGWLAVKKTVTAATDTEFVVECIGGSSSILAANDANGQYAVWSGYEAVYFFNGNLNDRTTNARNLTVKVGSATYGDVWGGCGSALDTSGAAFQASIDNGITASAIYTMSATLVMDTNTTENQQAMTFCQTYGSSTNRSTLGNQNSGETFTTYSASDSWLDAGGLTVGSVSTRLAAVYNGSTDRKIYRQGILAGTDTTITSTSMDTLCIGGGSASGANWRGRIGFAYLRLEAMSADWLAAEALNLRSPQRFYDLA